jgi:AcrR family transcriptional regulator
MSRAIPPLTQEGIVEAALRVADEEGFEAVSMRRVAKELGVGAMTLYTYVKSKEELIALMSDAMIGEVVIPGAVPDDWREALTEIARRTRATWLRHPWVLSAFGQRPTAPPPNAVRHVEQSAQAVASLDLDAPTAFAIVEAVDDYTIGCVIRELGDMHDPDDDEWHATMGTTFREVLGTDSPHAERFLDPAVRRGGDERFELGLRWLLDGIEASLSRS